MFRGLSAWRGLPAWCGASHAKSRTPGAAEGLAPRDGASQPSDGAPCSMVPQPPHLGSLILLRPLIGNAERLPGPERRERQAGGGAGGGVGGGKDGEPPAPAGRLRVGGGGGLPRRGA